MSELAELQRIDGLDTDVGMAAVGGRLEFYHRLLAMFVRAHEPQVEPWLRGALMADNGAALRKEELHRLRGAAATLGLIAIDETGRLLELELSRSEITVDGNASVQSAAAFGEALKQGIEALKAVPSVAAAINRLP